MKLNMNTIMALSCILMAGCQESAEQSRDEHAINSQLINSYHDISIQNALVSEHTLFPYHFVENAAELNELGQRDLAALATHFVKHAGHLNVRRHNTPADLYEARLKVVHGKLQEAGIEMERMSISDDMPGGSGVPSERILVILQKADAGASTGGSGATQSGMR
jgi:hypothetical protein